MFSSQNRKQQIERFHRAGLVISPQNWRERWSLMHMAGPKHYEKIVGKNPSKFGYMALEIGLALAMTLAAVTTFVFLLLVAQSLVLGTSVLLLGSSYLCLLACFTMPAWFTVFSARFLQRHPYDKMLDSPFMHVKWDKGVSSALYQLKDEDAVVCAEYLLKLEQTKKELDEAKSLLAQVGEDELIHEVKCRLLQTAQSQAQIHQMLSQISQ